MRKRYWVLLAIMVFGGAGNLIGGRTPGGAAVDPADGSGVMRADVPVAPRFDATLYVSASSLNLREAPSTGGRVRTSLPRNRRALAVAAKRLDTGFGVGASQQHVDSTQSGE